MLQLRGIDKKIAALKTELNYSTSGDRDQFLAGLSNLQTEKARLAQGAIRAHHDSESERSRSPSSKGEEDATVVMSTPPPSQGGAADRDSDSDDGSVREAEDLQELARHSAELIGPGITVTQKELRNQFHLPLHTVAKKFGMCTTAFKKLCRRFGIAKWPHRQLRGIDKKIAALKAELNYSSVDKETARRNLLKLEEEKARLSQGAEWTGLGLDLEVETHSQGHDDDACRVDADSSDAEEQESSSSRRVGIRNLLCEEEEEEEEEERGADLEGSDCSESVHGIEEKKLNDVDSATAGVAVTDDVLREHFHLPLQLVAKKFGMCTTAFKKLCRRFGIAKWPHRQLRGIDKKIAALKAELNYSSVDKETARRNLVALEEEKARLSRVAVGGASAARRGGAGSKRKQHTPEQDMAKSARTAQYSSDASALDLLAAVAGIGGPCSEAVSTGRRQLAPLHAASSSGSNSSISTPGLEPLSPATVPRQQHSVSPLISSAPAGAWGAAGGMGARMQSLQSCAEAPAPNGLVGVGGDSLGGLSLNSLRILLHQQQQQASGEAGLLGLGGAHSSLARPASANTTTPQQHRVACVGFWNLPSFVTHQVQ